LFGAAAKRPLKSAMIGTGGRGTGAANDHVQAAKELGVDLKMVMLGDVFEDRLERSLAALKNVGIDLSRGQCVLGFDAYKRVMEADVDIVLLTTPPELPAGPAGGGGGGREAHLRGEARGRGPGRVPERDGDGGRRRR
jgi:hypothetical protein